MLRGVGYSCSIAPIPYLGKIQIVCRVPKPLAVGLDSSTLGATITAQARFCESTGCFASVGHQVPQDAGARGRTPATEIELSARLIEIRSYQNKAVLHGLGHMASSDLYTLLTRMVTSKGVGTPPEQSTSPTST